jgi:hypothetical protein
MSGVSILPSILSNMFFTVFSRILGVYILDVVLLATDAWRTVGRWGYCPPVGHRYSIGTGILAILTPTSFTYN